MSNLKNIHTKILSNSSWLIGDKTLSSVFSALQAIVVARILGVEQYGLLVLVMSYIDLLNQFIDFRVWETAIKYIGMFWDKYELEKTRSIIKLLYLIDFVSGIVACLISIATAKIISQYIIHTPEAYKYIWIYSLNLLIGTSSSTSIAILRIFNRYKIIAVVRSSQYLIRMIIVISMLLLGFGISGVIFGLVIASLFGVILRTYVVMRTLNEHNLGNWWKSSIRLINDQFKGIFWYIANTNLSATIKMGQDRFFGMLILGYFSGKDAVAFYKIAASAATIISFLIVPLYEAIYPEFVKLKSQDVLGGIKALINSVIITYVKISIPVTLIVIFFSNIIITIAFGKNYLPASNALRIIAIASIIDGLTFWITPVLLTIEKPGMRTVISLISTSSYLILLIALVPSYSFIGAAYAFLGFVLIKTLISFGIFRNSQFVL